MNKQWYIEKIKEAIFNVTHEVYAKNMIEALNLEKCSKKQLEAIKFLTMIAEVYNDCKNIYKKEALKNEKARID